MKRIFVTFVSTEFGENPDYINYIDEESVQTLIEAVYEPHFARYGHEFGKTIMGFYNTSGIGPDRSVMEPAGMFGSVHLLFSPASRR